MKVLNVVSASYQESYLAFPFFGF